jgi:hypothetical protein
MLMTPPDDTTAITVNVPLSSFNGWSATTAAEVVGLQWQLTNPTTATCAASLTVDDVKFLP